MATTGSPCYNGDTVVLYCAESNGHIYCEPRSSSWTLLTVHPQCTPVPHFPNVHFAVFRIIHAKPSCKQENSVATSGTSSIPPPQPKIIKHNYSLKTAIACGGTVKLQHIASKKFLTVQPPPQSAWLSDEEASVFRLLPTRREKIWGEDVHYGNSIRLESVYYKGQRIQCVHNPRTSKYELVLAVTGSTMIVKPHCSLYSPLNSDQLQHCIRGSEVVTLKWKHINGFLSAKGSTVSEVLPEWLKISPKVGLRRWDEHQWQLRANPSSADTYFQLEKVSDPSLGDCFTFNERCRIKHVLTQRYLNVMEENRFLLCDSFNGKERDQFELIPTYPNTGQSELISLSDDVLFQNVHTGMLLSAYAQRIFLPDNSCFHQIDPLSQKFELKMEAKNIESNSNHSFLIQRVHEDSVTEIYYVVGVAYFLSNCVMKVTSDTFKQSDQETRGNHLRTFQAEIEAEMTKMCEKLQSLLNTKRLANMLRITQVIDAMIVLLDYIGTENETAHSICSHICSTLTEYAKSANKKSRLYIASKQFLKTLLLLVDKNVKVEGVLFALVKDDNQMSRSIKTQLSLCAKTSSLILTENHEVLRLLRHLSLQSTPFLTIQNKLLERTLKELHMIKSLTDSQKETIQIVLKSCIKQSQLEQSDLSQYFLRQQHIFYYDDDLTQLVPVDLNEHLTTMDNHIRKFLRNERFHYLYCNQEYQKRNDIILEMLKAVLFLCIRNAYMNNESVTEVVNHLSMILDGSTDSMAPDKPFDGNQRLSNSKLVPGNTNIFRIKTQVLKIFCYLLKQHLKSVLQLFLDDFKYFYSRFIEIRQDDDTVTGKPSDNSVISFNATQVDVEKKSTFRQLEKTNVHEDIEMKSREDLTENTVPPPLVLQELLKKDPNFDTYGLTTAVETRLRDLYKQRFLPSQFNTDDTSIVGILMDLLDYDDDDLQVDCAQFLYDLFTVELKILNEAEKSYLIFPCTDNEKKQKMIAVGTSTDDDKLLGRMIKMDYEDVTKLVSTLRRFGDWCVDENDETRPNVIMQGVAYSSGLFSAILRYVLEYGPSEYIDQEEILKACFYFLQRLARGNSRVQQKLVMYFPDLMGVRIAVSSMIALLNEIFAYNSEVCEKLTELDIELLFHTMIASSNSEHFELALTLRVIVDCISTASNLQEMISHMLMDHWSDNIGYLLGVENISVRFKLLEQENNDKPELILLLNIADLMAACSEGECKSAENVSRFFFPLDELLSIILNQQIPIHRKTPFINLLTWTHLNTERDSLESCDFLAKQSKFWMHLKFMSSHRIDDFVKFVQKMKISGNEDILKMKLKCLKKLYLTKTLWTNISNELNQLEMLVDCSTRSTLSVSSPFWLSDWILYFFEGVLPFISAFCSEFALHLSGPLNSTCTSTEMPVWMPVLKEIEASLTVLTTQASGLLSASKYIVNVKSCHEEINSLSTEASKIWQILDEPARLSIMVKTPAAPGNPNAMRKNRRFSQQLLDCEDDGATEVHLNATFQVYIENYRKVYMKQTNSDCIADTCSSPCFERIVDLFSDSSDALRHHHGSTLLKVEKLLQILKTLATKQKRQGLQSAEKPKLEKITLFTLRLISAVVERQIKQIFSEDPVVFRRQFEEMIYPLQKKLLEKGAADVLIELLQHAREDVAFQVLACLNVLLYFGNEKAQKIISKLINKESKGIFVRIQQLLSKAQSSLTQARLIEMLNRLMHPPHPAADQSEISTTAGKPSLALMKRNKSAVFISLNHQESEETDIVANIEKVDLSIDHRVIVALNLLSWLCDGQKKNMQNILREQKLFARSNIVSQVAFLFHGVAENIKNQDNVPIAQRAVQSLIEMCAGNYENKELAFKGQVIVSIDEILCKSSKLNKNRSVYKALLELQCSCIELVEAMVEETNVLSPELGLKIFSHFELSNFLLTMMEIWDEYTCLRPILNKDFLQKSLFRGYHVLRRIADYEHRDVNKLVGYLPKHVMNRKVSMFKEYFNTKERYLSAKGMWEYCQSWSKSIEVVYTTSTKEEILTRAYFYYDPHKHLNEHKKDEILRNIKRNTPEEKLTDLLHWTKSVRKYKNRKEFLKKHPLARWIIGWATIRHFILYWLTILLNLLMLFSFSVPDNYDPESAVCDDDGNHTQTSCLYFKPVFIPKVHDWYHITKYTFGSFHLILAVWMFAHHMLKNWIIFTFRIPVIYNLLNNVNKGCIRRRQLYKLTQFIRRRLCCQKCTLATFSSDVTQLEFFSFEPIYRGFFVLFSLIGFIGSGYFYCGCMFYIFIKNNVLRYILKAIRKSALQLITILLIGLVLIYIYAVITFTFGPNYFNPEQDQFCQTLFQCFITVTRFGLLDSLGTSVPVRPYPNYDPNFKLVGARTVYDLVFFITITVLGLNIVIAILVDRFSNLREEQEKINIDNTTRCLICSIPNDAFESRGLDFNKHKKEDHFMWNYIHYALYLDEIHSNDHNALEKYVYEQISSQQSSSIKFYPLRQAKTLPDYKP